MTRLKCRGWNKNWQRPMPSFTSSKQAADRSGRRAA